MSDEMNIRSYPTKYKDMIILQNKILKGKDAIKLIVDQAILNQFMIGVGYGWIGPTLLKLQSSSCSDTICTNSTGEASWIASVHETGKFMGPLISPLIVDNVGRKYTLVLVAIMYLTSNTIVVFARDIHILYMARIIFGFANAVNDVVSGIYIAENSSPSVRGIFSSLVVLTFYAGLSVEYILSTYLSYTNTAVINTIFSCTVFVTLYFWTETPYFLIMKGKYKQAEESLLWLRDGTDQTKVAEELNHIEWNVLEERRTEKFLERFKSAANLKALCAVIGLNVLSSATGGGAFLAYGTIIFSSTDTFIKADHFPILYCVVLVVMVLVSPFFIEKVERRVLIVGSFLGMTCSNICSFVLMYYRYELTYYPWLIFASIAVYGLFSSIASTASFAVRGELLPLSVRAIGSSIGVMSQSLASFCVLKIFIPIKEYCMPMNFLIFSVAGMMATLFVYMILPETRGKSLYEIQNSLKAETDRRDSGIEEAEDILEQKHKNPVVMRSQ